MSHIEGGRIGTTGFECSICYGGTPGLYDKEMMDEQLKSQLQHRIVVEGDSKMRELSEICEQGHMCCTKCHEKLLRMPRKACPTCRRKLLPIGSRKIHLYSHEDAVKKKQDSDSAQSRADARKVEYEASVVAGVVVVNAALANAIENQHGSAVFEVLLDGANAKACLENGLPLVVHAARMNYWNKVIMLLNAGAYSTACNPMSNESLICMAVRACNAKAVTCLLKDHMISANSSSPEGEHLVIEAAILGHWIIVFLLLDNGARIASQSLQGESVVDIAFRTSSYDAVKELVTRKAEVNFSTPAFKNSLINAAFSGNWPCVFVLLDAGACPKACNSENESLLYMAVSTYHRCKVGTLLQKYAVPADSLSPTGEPLIIVAAMLMYWDIVFVLLGNGARIDSQSLQNESLTDIAFRTSHYSAIIQLMSCNAEVDFSSPVVKDSVTNAASSGKWNYVFHMLDAGVCPMVCNSENESLTDIAFRTSHYSAIIKLMSCNAEVDFSSPLVKNSVTNAASSGNWNYVFHMLDAGVCPMVCNSENESLLYIAVYDNCPDSVEKLLQKYALAADSLSPTGEPLTIEAATERHWAVVFVLLDNGANKARLSLQGVSLVDIAIRQRSNPALLDLIKRNAGVDLLSPAVKDCLTDTAMKRDWYNVFILLDAGVCPIGCNSDQESLLYIAVRGNYIDSAQKLLQKYEVPADSLSPEGEPLVIVAAELRLWVMVLLFCENGASCNCQTSENESLISIAVQADREDIVTVLLERGVSANSLSFDEPLIALTVRQVQWGMASILLKSGASALYRTDNNEGLLDIAIRQYDKTRSDEQVVRMFIISLIERGVPVSLLLRDNEILLDIAFQHYDKTQVRAKVVRKFIRALKTSGVCGSLLSHQSECKIAVAAQKGNWRIVQIMLDAGAAGNGHTEYDASLIAIAFQRERFSIVGELLQRGVGANSLSVNGQPLVAEAAFDNLWDIVEKMVRAGAFVDSRTSSDESLLSIAVQRNQVRIVDLLIQHGATVNSCTETQESLISHAAANRYVDVFLLLIKGGAQLDTRSVSNVLLYGSIFLNASYTPEKMMQTLPPNINIAELCTDTDERLLPAMAMGNNWDGVYFMLSHGACVHSETKLGESAISIAVQRHSKAIGMLLRHGARADSFTAKKEHLVLFAASQHWWDTVQTLISADAPIDCIDAAGNTLLYMAVALKQLNRVVYVHDAGASFDASTPQGNRIITLAHNNESETIYAYLLNWNYSAA